MFNEKAVTILNNIVDEETLRDNLSFTAFYIALYENFSYLVKERIEGFYCIGAHIEDDGTIKYNISMKYKTDIVNRVVDSKGNKDVLKASMLWFVDQGAITLEEYEYFLKMKEQRNRFVHELASCILHGNTDNEIGMFFDMFALSKKIDKWWINEIEIPSSGEFLPNTYNSEEVESIASGLFQTMIDILYLGKSKAFKNSLEIIVQGRLGNL